MEGAVRSGYLAAEACSARRNAKKISQPDLPPDGLIAMWLGKPNSATLA